MTADGISSASTSDSDYRPCDARYRNSRYFLQDQLKCSQAAEDFRSVKQLLDGLSSKESMLPWARQRD